AEPRASTKTSVGGPKQTRRRNRNPRSEALCNSLTSGALHTGATGLEPATPGFGDRCATNCATPLGCSADCIGAAAASRSPDGAWNSSQITTAALDNRCQTPPAGFPLPSYVTSRCLTPVRTQVPDRTAAF